MKISLAFETDGIVWERAAELFRRAPLGLRNPKTLRRAFENSDRVCFAFDGRCLVGAVRALTDEVYQAAVYDLVVLPEYQGLGIGRRLMAAVHERLSVGTIILYAVPGKEPFYRKLGYAGMLTAMARRTESMDAFRSNGYVEDETDGAAIPKTEKITMRPAGP